MWKNDANEPRSNAREYPINPKALSLGELYGEFDLKYVDMISYRIFGSKFTPLLRVGGAKYTPLVASKPVTYLLLVEVGWRQIDPHDSVPL